MKNPCMKNTMSSPEAPKTLLSRVLAPVPGPCLYHHGRQIAPVPATPKRRHWRSKRGRISKFTPSFTHSGLLYSGKQKKTRKETLIAVCLYLLGVGMGRRCVISGGTATNAILDALTDAPVLFVLPVSDDGASTGAIVRSMGGPAIGDTRARVAALATNQAVKEVITTRVDSLAEWRQVLDRRHAVWSNLDATTADLIAASLESVDARMAQLDAPFDFCRASLGNLFVLGMMIQGLDFNESISRLSQLCQIDPAQQIVLPCVNGRIDDLYVLGAQLHNGRTIRGQNEISHPLTASDSAFESPIGSVFFLDGRGEHETRPAVNHRVVAEMSKCDTLIYSIGSLWTSICAVVAVKGMAQAIARVRRKILLVNSQWDRETHGLDVEGYLRAVAGSFHYSKTGERIDCQSMSQAALRGLLAECVDEVVVLDAGQPQLGSQLASLPVKIHLVAGSRMDPQTLSTFL